MPHSLASSLPFASAAEEYLKAYDHQLNIEKSQNSMYLIVPIPFWDICLAATSFSSS
jgi:hypothetical protein